MNSTNTVSHRLHLALQPGLRAGDWVEVKPQEEVLASLDENGTLDGMPFMPEMLQYCGRRFKVYKRAHKTCDYSQGMQARRVTAAVHLEGARCSGQAHGGCQAECLLFWKEAWLKPVDETAGVTRAREIVLGQDGNMFREREPSGCTVERLTANTCESVEGEPVYLCQGTTIQRFSTPLRGVELDQYVEAYTSRNVRLREMPPPLIFRAYDRLVWSRLADRIPQWVRHLQKLRGVPPHEPVDPGEKQR